MNKPINNSSPRLLLNNAAWALKTVWRTNARLMMGLIVFAIVRGILPAGLAIFARGLVNALVDLFGASSLDMAPVIPWLVMGFVLTLFEALLPLAHKYSILRLKDDVNIKVTGDILEHASKLDLAFFEDPGSQRVVERAQQDTAERFSLFVQDIIRSATCLLQVISLAGVLAYIEPLVLVVLGPIGLPYLWQQWRLARKRFKVEFRRAPKRRWSNYFVTQMTSRLSIPEVKLFNLGPHFIERFKVLLNEFREQDRRLYLRGSLGGGVFAIVATLAFYVLFFKIVVNALNGGLTIGDVAVFGTASSRLRVTLEQMILALSSALEQTLYITNLRTFLEAGPLLLLPAENGADVKGSPTEGALTFESVSFTYPSAESPTLRDISFDVKPGEIIGLVGENGAGKTTLVKLICRLYDVTHGRVLIDGEDVKAYEVEKLQKAITFVLQHFGRYEATAEEKDKFYE